MKALCRLSAKVSNKSNAFSVAYSYCSCGTVFKMYMVNCLDSILPFLFQKLGNVDEISLFQVMIGEPSNFRCLRDPLCGTPRPGLLGSCASVFRDFCIRMHLQKAFDKLKAFENH